MTRKVRARLTDTHVQLTNDAWAPLSTAGPRAQREQATSGEYDELMTTLARRNHPTVAWWWGFRQSREDGHVAVCYVCDQWFTKVRPSDGLTDHQRKAVLDHRAMHWTQMRGEIKSNA